MGQGNPFIARMYQRDDGEWLAEVLADVEQDLSGNTSGVECAPAPA